MEREKTIPCVTVVGHIDHGKSTLLGALSNTALSKEAGGITQIINVFLVERESGARYSFLDTPGHPIFSDIRTRAVQASDAAILVVSTEEGVKPQTKESFEILSQSSTPFLVALTKTDSPSADVSRTKASLFEAHIFVEDMGGTIPVVEVSAKDRNGLDELLDLLSLLIETSDVPEEKTKGHCIVLDIQKEKGGRVKTLILVRERGLKKGEFVVDSSGTSTKATALFTTQNVPQDFFKPGEVAVLHGMDDAVLGDFCFFYASKKDIPAISLDTPSANQDIIIGEAQNKGILPCVIKVQNMSSLRAISDEIEKQNIPVKIVKGDVGEVIEKDVQFAITTGSHILAFGVSTDKYALNLATQNNVTIHSSDVIYTAMDLLKKMQDVYREKNEVKEIVGEAKIIRVFKGGATKGIYGARIQNGIFDVSLPVEITRSGSPVGKGKLLSIQQKSIECPVVEGKKTEFAFSFEGDCEVLLGDAICQTSSRILP